MFFDVGILKIIKKHVYTCYFKHSTIQLKNVKSKEQFYKDLIFLSLYRQDYEQYRAASLELSRIQPDLISTWISFSTASSKIGDYKMAGAALETAFKPSLKKYLDGLAKPEGPVGNYPRLFITNLIDMYLRIYCEAADYQGALDFIENVEKDFEIQSVIKDVIYLLTILSCFIYMPTDPLFYRVKFMHFILIIYIILI